jgi:hypothetical protein
MVPKRKKLCKGQKSQLVQIQQGSQSSPSIYTAEEGSDCLDLVGSIPLQITAANEEFCEEDDEGMRLEQEVYNLDERS